MKTGCENMRFSDRSYFKVLLPFLKDWHNKVKKPFKFDDLEILVDESDAGMDNANRHMNTKMVVYANTERIVLHAYNGTQNLMVQGKNFENLVTNYLQPYFNQKIQSENNLILQFNSNVQDKLGQKKTALKQDAFEIISFQNLKQKTKPKYDHDDPE